MVFAIETGIDEEEDLEALDVPLHADVRQVRHHVRYNLHNLSHAKKLFRFFFSYSNQMDKYFEGKKTRKEVISWNLNLRYLEAGILGQLE